MSSSIASHQRSVRAAASTMVTRPAMLNSSRKYHAEWNPASVPSQPKGSEKLTKENSTNTIHDVWSRMGRSTADKQDNGSAKDQRLRQHLKGGVQISFEPQPQPRPQASHENTMLGMWSNQFGKTAPNGLQPPLDISYGTYLYAWPVQQLSALYFSSFWSALVFSLSLTFVLATLSAVFIERPAL